MSAPLKTHKELRESEIFYRHLVELTPEAVVVHTNGKIVYANPTAMQLIGARNPKEVIGQGILQFIHPDYHAIAIARIAQLLQKKKMLPKVEMKFINTKGDLITAEVKSTLLIFQGESAVLSIIHDVTQQKKGQEELKRSRDQLEAILKNVADGISVQDAAGKLIYVNSAAAKMSGFPSPEAMLAAKPSDYINVFDLYDEKGKPFDFADLPGRRAILGEKNPSAVIKYINKKTNEIRWSMVKATTIYDLAGKPSLIINVINDLTERKELETRKDEFISMASHELKTPLTSIKIYSGVLQKHLESQKDEKAVSLQAKINKQLKSLSELVRELLDVSNIEKGKLRLKKEMFLVRDLAKEIVESLDGISDHHLVLDWHTKHPVFADKERIRQVLVNLVSNAMKYSSHGSKILLRSEKQDNKIVVSVQDYGMGISAKNIGHVFKRFYRVEEKEDKTYPGLGLGLYICNQIIKMHSGDMWLESELGKGSTFYFSLPIYQEKQ